MKVALVCLLGACGCATFGPRDDRVPASLGYTACAERNDRVVPIAYIRLDVLVSPEGPQVMAHESTHMLGIRRFASCKEYARWIDQGDNRARSEALAFCASSQVWSRQTGVPLDSAISKYATWLVVGYPQFKLDHERAKAMIKEPCQELLP